MEPAAGSAWSIPCRGLFEAFTGHLRRAEDDTTRLFEGPRSRRMQIIVAGLLCLPAPLLAILFVPPDEDPWFLIATGRHLLAHGFPSHDPLSMHTGFEIVVQQWLFAVVTTLVYNAAGMTGVLALPVVSALVLAAGTWLTAYAAAKRSWVTATLITFLSSFVLLPFYVPRPAIASAAIISLTVATLEWHRLCSRRALFALPLLSLLLINTHAVIWPLLPLVIGAYVLGSLSLRGTDLRIDKQLFRDLVITLVASLAAGFVNPYGWSAMTYVTRSLGRPEVDQIVSEMQPITINGVGGLALVILLICGYILVRRPGPTLVHAITFAAGSYLALAHVRSLLLFVILATAPLAAAFGSLRLPVNRSATPGDLRLRKILIAVLIVLAPTAVWLKLQSQGTLAITRPTPDWHLALDSIRADQATGEDMRLYAGYNEGPYAEFLGMHPYLDARAEVFFKENNKQADVLTEYLKLQIGRLDYSEFLKKYDFTHIVVNDGDILSMLLPEEPTYEKVGSFGTYSVYRATDWAP